MKHTILAVRLLTAVIFLVFSGVFSVYAATPPAAVLQSPLNAVNAIGASQDFTWSEVPEATHYRLWVTDSTNTVLFKKWFRADSTELSCNGTDCTTTVAIDFSSASFLFWRVRTSNSDGLGNWSNKGRFWSMQSRPVAATLVQPLDFVFGASPNFVWQPVPNATWYKLRLRLPGAAPQIIYDQWFRASTVCFMAFDCSQVVNPVPGNPQNYEWSVRTYSPAGLGPWAEFIGVELDDEPEIVVSGRYTVTPGGLSDFTTDCCSFEADGSYAIEIENAGGGSDEIVSIDLFEFRGNFSIQALDLSDECAIGYSLGAGESCSIGISFVNNGIDPIDGDPFGDGPPDGIFVEFIGSDQIFVPLTVALLP